MKTFGLILIAVLACGCRAQVEYSSKPIGAQPTGVEEIRLSDGTRCVTYYARGITCDWKKQ